MEWRDWSFLSCEGQKSHKGRGMAAEADFVAKGCIVVQLKGKAQHSQ